MTSLFDCPLILRSVLSVTSLIFFLLSDACIVVSFLQKNKKCFVLNIISFLSEFFVIIVLHSVVEYKIGYNSSLFLLKLSQIPVFIFVLLSLSGSLISLFSIFKSEFLHSLFYYNREDCDDDYMLCKRAEQLQKDYIRLTEMNRQLKQYGDEMQEQIKQKEILQAKTQIHNGMNKLLMISSRALETGNKEEIENAMSLWHRDALLLCKEAENEEYSNIMQDINSLAKLLNIKLVCKNIPEAFDEKTSVLFEKSACESMINAVKHANADVFEITVTQNGFYFTNNGDLPDNNIVFGGGLNEIKSLAQNAGYEMTIECNECFKLIINKRGNENGI